MKQTLDKYIGQFLAFLMSVMLVSVLWQITTRYFLGISSAVTDELARYLLIWIGTLGAAYVSGKKMHLAIDLLPRKLSGKSKQSLDIVINLSIILFALLAMVIGGFRLVYVTYILGQTSAALQIPLAYVYLILPFSGLLIIYYKINEILIIKENGNNDPGQSELSNSK
jgi:TRAP-type C4-dicarboxylate transport system permease small subunit